MEPPPLSNTMESLLEGKLDAAQTAVSHALGSRGPCLRGIAYSSVRLWADCGKSCLLTECPRFSVSVSALASLARFPFVAGPPTPNFLFWLVSALAAAWHSTQQPATVTGSMTPPKTPTLLCTGTFNYQLPHNFWLLPLSLSLLIASHLSFFSQVFTSCTPLPNFCVLLRRRLWLS